LACADEAGGALVRCAHVPASALDGALPTATLEVSDFVVRIDPAGTIVALDGLTRSVDPTTAIAAIAQAEQQLDACLPRPLTRTGPNDATTLATSAFARAAISGRFARWAVDVSATTLDQPGRVTVRWQSRALD
ncbi:MAG: hypothetical protein ACHREM_32025, partial [Polyangiales bacterium]